MEESVWPVCKTSEQLLSLHRWLTEGQQRGVAHLYRQQLDAGPDPGTPGGGQSRRVLTGDELLLQLPGRAERESRSAASFAPPPVNRRVTCARPA